MVVYVQMRWQEIVKDTRRNKMGKSRSISEFLASIDFTDGKYQVIDVATVDVPEDATFGFFTEDMEEE